MSSFDVQSTTGATVRFYAIALPFTSNQMKQWLDEANFFRVRHSIDKAIKVARFIGCDVIALGPVHVDRDEERDDAAAAARRPDDRQQLHHRAGAGSHRAGPRRTRHSTPAEATLAVVGASGNIGQTCAEILAPRFGRTVLLGSSKPSALRRLAELQARLPRAQRRCRRGGAASGGRRARGRQRPDAVSQRRGVCRRRDRLRSVGAGGGPSGRAGRSGPTCS